MPFDRLLAVKRETPPEPIASWLSEVVHVLKGCDGTHTHTTKWHSCWQKVQAQGKTADSAAAICTSSLGEASLCAAKKLDGLH